MAWSCSSIYTPCSTMAGIFVGIQYIYEKRMNLVFHHLVKCLFTVSQSWKLEMMILLNWVQAQNPLLLSFWGSYVSAGDKMRKALADASRPIHSSGLQGVCWWLSFIPHNYNTHVYQPWFISHLWPCLSNPLILGHYIFLNSGKDLPS